MPDFLFSLVSAKNDLLTMLSFEKKKTTLTTLDNIDIQTEKSCHLLSLLSFEKRRQP